MGAGHDHDRRSERGDLEARKRLRIVLFLSLAYMVAEAVGGWLANSLALLADAGHMLTDVAALALTLFAAWIGRRPSTPQRTYGYYRAEILAALANAAGLVALSAWIVVEAIGRFSHPQAVRGPAVLAVASGGLIVNLVGLRLLHATRGHSLNLRGAWIHVGADAVGSLGAILAGSLTWSLGWTWSDPAAGILIALLVVYSSWRLLLQALDVLMEGTPRGIDAESVRGALLSVPGVAAVHDLHIWTITSGMHALSAHVAVPRDEARAGLLGEIGAILSDRFGIDHVTIQVEQEGDLAPDHCAERAGHP